MTLYTVTVAKIALQNSSAEIKIEAANKKIAKKIALIRAQNDSTINFVSIVENDADYTVESVE